MNIRIEETGTMETLSLTDPDSGISWINDLMGNYGALPDRDPESNVYVMSQEDFDWWADLTAEYQDADDRWFELRQSLTGDDRDQADRLMQSIDCDLEDLPGLIQQTCDDVENNLSLNV